MCIRDRASPAFVGAVVASVAWVLASLIDQFSPYMATTHVAMALDWLRYGLWLLFLMALVQSGVRSCLLPTPEGGQKARPDPVLRGGLTATALGLWLAGALLLALLTAGGQGSRWMSLWLLTALGLSLIHI